jgi:1-acyl-sn-glycerol-3-phosphate acyltransferase
MALQLSYWSGRGIVDLYARLALGMDIVRQGAWPEGPKIVAANHPTTTDPFYLMTAVSEQMSILVTEMAFEVPVFGEYLRAAEHIPVSAEKGRLAFELAAHQLQRGRTIGIFPEGALSPLAEGLGFHRARTGAVRLALSAGVPILPVGIAMDYERIHYSEVEAGDQSETARWYPIGPYALTVGRAIYLEGEVEDWEFVRAASQNVMHEIARLARQSDQRVQRRAPAFCPWLSLVRSSTVGEGMRCLLAGFAGRPATKEPLGAYE